MKLRFFADHCVSNYIIDSLSKEEYEVLLLRDHIPIDSDDQIVISKAQELNSILISLNGDFADITNFRPSNYKGIISLQVKNHPEIIPAIMKRLNNYLSSNDQMSY